MTSSLVTAVLVTLATSVAGLLADEVTLTDGRVLEGEVISRPGADILDLRTGSSSLSVIQHFPRSQVASVSFGVSPRQKALEAIASDAKRLANGGTAEEWWALAERAREAGDSPYHRELATITVERNRNHAAARRSLGMIQYKGVWMRPNEAAVARGEVLYEGRYLTWADREEAIHQAQLHRELVAARRAEQEKAAHDRRMRAAAEAAAYDPGPGSGIEIYSSAYSQGVYNPGSYYHSVYWPNLCQPVATPYYNNNCNSGSNLTIAATGSSGNSSWGLIWRN